VSRASFDRSSELRTRSEEMARLLADPTSLVVPVWRHRCLVVSSEAPVPSLLSIADCQALLAAGATTVFLGLRDGSACFAVTVPPEEQADEAPLFRGRGEFVDLRLAGVVLGQADAELLTYARGILLWHRHHRFCANCGAETTIADGGHMRRCDACDRRHFPRLDPAMMALVLHQDRCLLARQPAFPPGMYSLLAGFVEIGESLEQSVAREVREEVGLEVDDVRYLRSQAWPFPSSLMLGFMMRARDAELRVDKTELEDARWVRKSDLGKIDGMFTPPRYSLAGQLLELYKSGALD
jgi:NAD+ diphosphatase